MPDTTPPVAQPTSVTARSPPTYSGASAARSGGSSWRTAMAATSTSAKFSYPSKSHPRAAAMSAFHRERAPGVSRVLFGSGGRRGGGCPSAQHLGEHDGDHGGERQRRIEKGPEPRGNASVEPGDEVEAQPEDERDPHHEGLSRIHARAQDDLHARHDHEARHEDEDGAHDGRRHHREEAADLGQEAQGHEER